MRATAICTPPSWPIRTTPTEMARVHEAVEEIFDTARRMGGTLSGEHGIGIAKMSSWATRSVKAA